MQKKIIFLMALIVCLAAAFAGCTGSSASAAPGTTANPEDNLRTSPTDAVPSQNQVTVTVGEKDYAGKIPVTFDGGMGQVHVKKIEVMVYCADGQVRTATIGANKGDSQDIQGTKQADRVVVYVTFDNGTRLKTNDVMSPYRTR